MKRPAFQFFVRDWIASATVARLHRKNPLAVSAYVYLLCHAWLETPTATLPNDTDELAGFAHLSPSQFEEVWPLIQHQFESDGNGRLFNIRQREALEKSITNQQNGSKGGNPQLKRKRSVNPAVKPSVKQEYNESG